MAPQFTSEAAAEIETLAGRYPKRQAALLPVLHLAQREFGHLSIEVQALVAKTLDAPPVLVREVTTFYEMFHEHAEGQFHLEVCTNISCHLAGADCIVDHLQKTLGVKVGHQDAEGIFSLTEAECLASCGSAPMMRVGMDYYEFLTIPAVDALLGRLKTMAPSLDGKAYEEGPNGPHTGPVPGFEPAMPPAGEAAPTAKATEEGSS